LRLLVNAICYLQRMLSHSFFLLNRYESLLGNMRVCVHFDLIIDKFMSRPFGFAGAILEVNFISTIFTEEGFDCRG